MMNRARLVPLLFLTLTLTLTLTRLHASDDHWIGTWAAAPQPPVPGEVQTFRNQTVRLIVHTSAGGTKVRLTLSNTFGDKPLQIGSAHIARRTTAADIDPSSDRALTFNGKSSIDVPTRSRVVSDPVDLDVPPLADLAISLFFPTEVSATTVHVLALQTNYVSREVGDATAAAQFPVDRTIVVWPFLTGVDVVAPPRAVAIAAFGSSTTDGDGSTKDTNARWPDILAAALNKPNAGEFGVLNEGIIGNRLLHDSPHVATNPFGAALGEAGMTRFTRDVLEQAGVRYVFVCLGVNDILFPGFAFTPPSERVTPDQIIGGYRQLIGRAHAKKMRVIGTT